LANILVDEFMPIITSQTTEILTPGSIDLWLAVTLPVRQVSPGIFAAFTPILLMFCYRRTWFQRLLRVVMFPVTHYIDRFLPRALPVGYCAENQFDDEFHHGSMSAILAGTIYVALILMITSSIQLIRKVFISSIEFIQWFQRNIYW
jgi:apolipoprotein N-acyltransferase